MRVALTVLSLCLAFGGPVAAEDAPATPPAPADPAPAALSSPPAEPLATAPLSPEDTYETLAAELHATFLRLQDDSAVEPALLVEAEAIALVAEDILTEGDVETALVLVEEALALLAGHPDE